MRLLVLLFLVLYTFSVKAQEKSFALGATALALGKCSATSANGFASVNNTAATTKLSSPSVAFNTDTRYLLNELFAHHLVLSIPTGFASLGFDAGYQGFSQYNKTTSALSIAKQLHQKISAGVRFNYYHISTSEKFNNHHFSTQLSLFATITEHVSIGATSSFFHNTASPLIKIGGCYHEKDWRVVSDVIWDTATIPYINLGAEYQIYPCVYVRAGMAKNLSYPTLGMGFDIKRLIINTAIEYHQALGITPTFDLIITFEKT